MDLIFGIISVILHKEADIAPSECHCDHEVSGPFNQAPCLGVRWYGTDNLL